MPFLEQPHCQLSSWVWWMNSTVASSAVDSEVPQLRRKSQCLHWALIDRADTTVDVLPACTGGGWCGFTLSIGWHHESFTLSFPLLWKSCIRLVRKSLKASAWGNAWDSSVTPLLGEAEELRCDVLGKVNFTSVPKLLPTCMLCELGRCHGEQSGFVLVSEQQII